MLSKEGGNSNQIVVQRIIKLNHVGIGRNFSVWLIRKKLMIKKHTSYLLFSTVTSLTRTYGLCIGLIFFRNCVG